MAVGELGAHFQPVGLQQVERAQHAVESAQDADVVLGPGQLPGVEGLASSPP